MVLLLLMTNTKYTVFVRSFICDAPVRAFLKGIKGHGGDLLWM